MLQQVDIEGDLFAYFLAFEVPITILQQGESDWEQDISAKFCLYLVWQELF